MERYDITMRAGPDEAVSADAYAQEGPMTTFFELGEGRDVVDCWARRVASIRTADIQVIRRVAAGVETLRVVG